jgi:hypothetical protein
MLPYVFLLFMKFSLIVYDIYFIQTDYPLKKERRSVVNNEFEDAGDVGARF